MFQGRNTLICTQEYYESRGKSQVDYIQTLIAVELTKAQLPIFVIEPEGFLNSLFGMDIDFSAHPNFSKRYKLYGPNEAHIRQFFTDKILSYYEQQPTFSTIGGGKYLVIYQHNVLLKPKQIINSLNFMGNLANLFSAR